MLLGHQHVGKEGEKSQLCPPYAETFKAGSELLDTDIC